MTSNREQKWVKVQQGKNGISWESSEFDEDGMRDVAYTPHSLVSQLQSEAVDKRNSEILNVLDLEKEVIEKIKAEARADCIVWDRNAKQFIVPDALMSDWIKFREDIDNLARAEVLREVIDYNASFEDGRDYELEKWLLGKLSISPPRSDEVRK